MLNQAVGFYPCHNLQRPGSICLGWGGRNLRILTRLAGTIRRDAGQIVILCASLGQIHATKAATQITLAKKNCVDTWQQLCRGFPFMDIAACSRLHSYADPFPIRVSRQENDLATWSEPADLTSDLDAMQPGEVHVQQNEVRLYFFRGLNSLHSIRCNTHNLYSATLSKSGYDEILPRHEIIDDKNAN